MKSKKTLLVLAAGLLATVTLAGCGGKKTKNEVTGVSFTSANYSVAPGGSVTVSAKATGTGKYDESVTITMAESNYFTWDATNLTVTAHDGLDVLGETVKLTATSVENPEISATANVNIYDLASGFYDYSGSVQDKTEILGTLEEYAVEHYLTGITFMGNGGYIMYADNIQKGSNSYIPGYGFGVLAEGRITGPLNGPGVAQQYNMYYHTYETDDPLNLNVMDSQESTVSTLAGYASASYWDTQMNETKDGYDWVGDLAKVDRPIPVGELDETGQTNVYKFPVKVGAELKYRSGSSIERFAAFNNREVRLEDYITPYQIYYTSAYGLARTNENLTGTGSIAGTAAYVEASADGFNANAWDKVGIKAYVDETDGLSYLEFTLNQKCTPFYAMYYLASSMFQPVPQEFILACGGANNTDLAAGVKNWGKPNEGSTEFPSDHWLSTGPFFVDKWNKNQNLVFTKNENYEDRGRYQIAGIHVNILEAAKEQTEAAINEFLAGNLSAAGIPLTRLDELKNDPRTTQTASSSNFKLNVNMCDADMWESLFGENGSVRKTAKADYWEVEPAMHLKSFVDGISYSINRTEFSQSVGRTPATSFFADTYLSDPENGISYNSTQAHKNAVAKSLAGTDNGYSLELAKASFKKASEELIENGDYEEGDQIEIEIAWQEKTDGENYGNIIAKYITDAFNACEGGLTLKVNNTWGAVWSDVYTKKCQVGQFDLGFGSISGNSYDPLNFFRQLFSTNEGGYTLNWGLDTNEVDGEILYDEKVWSFEGLWAAGDQGTVVDAGERVALTVSLVALPTVTRRADGGLQVEIVLFEDYLDDKNFAKFYNICLYATTDGEDYTDYAEMFADEENITSEAVEVQGYPCVKYTVVFTAEQIERWLEAFPPADIAVQGIDLHMFLTLGGKAKAPQYRGTIWQGYIPAIPEPVAD